MQSWKSLKIKTTFNISKIKLNSKFLLTALFSLSLLLASHFWGHIVFEKNYAKLWLFYTELDKLWFYQAAWQFPELSGYWWFTSLFLCLISIHNSFICNNIFILLLENYRSLIVCILSVNAKHGTSFILGQELNKNISTLTRPLYLEFLIEYRM